MILKNNVYYYNGQLPKEKKWHKKNGTKMGVIIIMGVYYTLNL